MSEPYGMTTGNRLQPPTAVLRHRLASPSGLAIEVLTLGATLHRIEIPDGAGGTVPLSLAVDGVPVREDPVRNPYLGVTVGRFANRIRDARFEIDDVIHELVANDGAHQLHGGPIGFSHVVWDSRTTSDAVVCTRVSPAGEMGYPGSLTATVTFTLDDRTIRISHVATTDAATPLSLTNHTYWNLGGPGEEDVGEHLVQVEADTVVPVDDDTLPMGPPIPVAGTSFDLRAPTRLRDRLGFDLPNGFDHCFMVRDDNEPGSGSLRRHARVTHPNGRALEVWSDQPAVQFYSGAFLSGHPGADGRDHDPFAALCLEPQQVPDAPNLPWAPSALLHPDQTYVHELELRLEWP